MNMFKKITEAVSSFNWIEKSRTRTASPNSTKEVIGVRLRVTSGKGGSHGAVTVYEDVMKKMNWVAGDRVRIGVDLVGGRLAIQRCLANGYALSANPKHNVTSRDLIGESVSSTAKFRLDGEHDFAKLISKSAVIPVDRCSFETNIVIIDVSESTQGDSA